MICLNGKKEKGKIQGEKNPHRSVSQNSIPFPCNISFKLLRWVLLIHLQLTDGEAEVQKDYVTSPR